MEASTLQHKFKFKLHEHTVTMKIYAYRKLQDFEIQSCISDYVRSVKRKKLKKDVEVKIQTIFGIEDPI